VPPSTYNNLIFFIYTQSRWKDPRTPYNFLVFLKVSGNSHSNVSYRIFLLYLLDSPSLLATTDMGRQLGEGCCDLFWGSWIPSIKHNVAWAEAYLCTKWQDLHPSSHLATLDMGQKWGAAVPLLFWGWGAGSPSNTISPGMRPTSAVFGDSLRSCVHAGGRHFEHMLRNYCLFVLVGSSEHL